MSHPSPSNSYRLALAVLAAAVLTAVPSPAQTDDYRVLDRIGGANVRLGTFPTRPMILAPNPTNPSNNDLWVVNQHHSKVERFLASNVNPANVYDVPWDPVAIALWDRTSPDDDQILVACRGTWVVVRLDIRTGEILGSFQIGPATPSVNPTSTRLGWMAEPTDLVVDSANDRAFVSCFGADSVVELDLGGGQITRIYHESSFSDLRCKGPAFMSLDASSGELYVAPMLAGNNSVWNGATTNGTTVIDPGAQDLPDQDLFRIVPSPADVDVVSTSLAAVQFGNAIRPTSSPLELWQLGTLANNSEGASNGDNQSEPEVRGRFTEAVLQIVDLSTGSSTPIDLDALGLGQPFGISFTPDGSLAAITDVLTDAVTVVDDTGALVHQWQISTGTSSRAIPRSTLISDITSTTWNVRVYCWGDNKIREYTLDLSSSPPHALSLTRSLRYDPTPVALQEGRSHFYDGSNSSNDRHSCASCHIEGGTDFLVWNLSNRRRTTTTTNDYIPIDDKGGMVTQTLVGVARSGMFHWRGERSLADFNDFAFEGLLGGSAMTSTEFAKLEAYLESLNSPANPHQNRERVVDAAIDFQTSADDAVDGQDFFFDTPVFMGTACADCHAPPTGSLSDVTTEIDEHQTPRRSHLRTAPLVELWRKEMSSVTINSIDRPFLGSALAHTGTVLDLGGMVAMAGSSAPDQDEDNMKAFVFQWDQGIAPAAHYAFFLDASSASGASTELAYLTAEAGKMNCDVAVIGKVHNGTNLVLRSWFWDRSLSTPKFVCENSNFADRTAADFISNTSSGEANLFVGLPPGMAERFAVDWDRDGLRNAADTDDYAPRNDPTDNTPPAFVGAQEIQLEWATARRARITFRTDEWSTAVVEYWPTSQTGAIETITVDEYSKFHSVLLETDVPSTGLGTLGTGPSTSPAVPYVEFDSQYEVVVRLRDRNYVNSSAETTNSTPFVFSFAPFVTPSDASSSTHFDPATKINHYRLLDEHVIDELAMPPLNDLSTTVTGSVDFELAYKRGATLTSSGERARVPAADRVVIGRFLVQHASGAFSEVPLSAITVGGASGSVDGEADVVSVCKYDHSGSTPVHATTGAIQHYTSLEVDGGGLVDRPFVYTIAPSGSSGATSISFTIDKTGAGLSSGERLHFVVDAVIRVHPDAWAVVAVTSGSGGQRTLHAPTDVELTVDGSVFSPGVNNGGEGFMRWSFPDTGEANSTVSRQL